MALINCPECGREVSSAARSCPTCGYPIFDTVKLAVTPEQPAPAAAEPAQPETAVQEEFMRFVPPLPASQPGEPAQTQSIPETFDAGQTVPKKEKKKKLWIIPVVIASVAVLAAVAAAVVIFVPKILPSESQNSEAAEISDTAYEKSENKKGLSDKSEAHTPVMIKSSPDKYTWYIKDYVGKNCASIGYTSLGGDRMDEYGESRVELIFVTADGFYVDYQSKDTLKEYVVTGQNIPPNSEMKIAFDTLSDGSEGFVDFQTYEEIVLSVRKVDSSEKNTVKLTEIKPAPDKYTWYIADYKGRNLATCGYVSLGGDFRSAYGDATIKFVIVSEDGDFIDHTDKEALKKYVVTGQNVEPNTEMNLVFDKLSDGSEGFVDYQNIEEIELTVRTVDR